LPRILRHLVFSPAFRLGVAALLGLVVAVVAGVLVDWAFGMLMGIATIGLVFVGAGLAVLWPMDGERTRHSARSEVLRPIADELVVALGAVLGIVVVVVPLIREASGTAETMRLATALLSVLAAFLCWAGLHLMYATRYADLFYDEEEGGGIDFHTDVLPSYRDFLYLSFAIGMTYGITDTDVSRTAVRSVVLRHAILSFVFGTAILATAIALVAGTF
jgi:uncharacterized membrane protein